MIGLARTGVAVTRWLAGQGVAVYASDAADTPAIRAAAQGLASPQVHAQCGAHDLDRIRRAAAVIVSPGVSPSAPPVAAARAAGLQVVAELDLAARALAPARLIVVTGTNGKSTTTALIGHLLAAAGRSAVVGGNIGRPLIEFAGSSPEWAVVEASSFQLHDAPHLAPTVGVLTNLAPDHQDRYAGVADYYADKRLLFRNAAPDSTWVLNADDPAVVELARGVPGTRRTWSLRGRADAWWDRSTGVLMLGRDPLLPRDRLPLLGDHNVGNALAAALAAVAASLGALAVGGGLASFQGLAHRLESVGEVNGVLWINDSKATNIASTSVALRAMTRPYVLILGGRHKGDPYTPLAPLLANGCRGIVAYGEAAPLVVRDLGTVAETHARGPFAEAVHQAGRLARAGDAVLLSPACSSFDQFTSYEERGATFRRWVESL
ncbi:MAG TPA: UDP-N-acetylmuramoyl-L-alanine--D-glutamate ligase [Gemmatimonadales bacterium]